jgi:hypothetical protein
MPMVRVTSLASKRTLMSFFKDVLSEGRLHCCLEELSSLGIKQGHSKNTVHIRGLPVILTFNKRTRDKSFSLINDLHSLASHHHPCCPLFGADRS